MADRLSKINGVVEYEAVHKDRLTNLNSMVEYEAVHKDRLSKIVVMVEYVATPMRYRITGKNAIINWIWAGGTVVLNTDYRSLNISESVDMADTTASYDIYKTAAPTTKSASIDYSGLYPAGTAGTVLVGALAAGNKGTLQVYFEGTAAASLLRTYPSIVASSKVNVPFSDIVEISCSLTSNGAWS